MADAQLSCNGWNAEYVDALYEQWRADRESVDAQWRQFFQGFELGVQRDHAAAPQSVDVAHTKQGHVGDLVYHFRDIGHLAARLDPLGSVRPLPTQLDTETYGLDPCPYAARFTSSRICAIVLRHSTFPVANEMAY